MSKHILWPLAGAGAIALAISGVAATSASAGGHAISPSFHHGVAPATVHPDKRGDCYSNLSGDTGAAYTSQNFESSFDIYDNAGADNFATKYTCKATGVTALGSYYNGSGPANSETVTFYSDSGGMPGGTIDSQSVTGIDSAGSFAIPLSTVALPPGHKWVSVVVNMDFSSGGQWGWEATTNQKGGGGGGGAPAMWENPGDGFSTGCTTWSVMQTCLGAAGPDYMVAVTKG